MVLADTVSVIVVTFNSAQVIEECLRSVLDAESAPNIIIVDNASTDGTLAIVGRVAPKAVVLRNDLNVGFARAVNRGVSKAANPYILLLNPDALISGWDVSRLVDFFDERADVGVAAPLMIEAGGAHPTIAAGMSPSLWRMFTHSTGLSRFGTRWRRLAGHYVFASQMRTSSDHEVDWVSGGCLFTRKRLWDDLGGLDERWFMYAEDVDYCIRVRETGSRCVVVGTVPASHAVGMSSASSEASPAVRTVWIENLFDLYMYRLAPSSAHAWLWKHIVSLGFDARAFVASARGQEGDRVRFRAYSSALRSVRLLRPARRGSAPSRPRTPWRAP